MSRRRKRRKKGSEEIDESWLLPYADLMTLLLALFIVLFSSSTIDEEKFEEMSSAFNEIFSGGKGIMDHTAPTPALIPNEIVDDGEEINSYTEDQKSLKGIQSRIDEYIAVHELENQFETIMTEEGLLVTIRDSILFNSGRADIKEEYLPLVDELAEILVLDPPRHIVIAGHTDNVPMNNAEFSSNWDLSVMRAVNLLKLMVNNDKLDPLLFSAKGFGEFQPIGDNDTAEGRSKNRRVEVLIRPIVLQDGKNNSNE